MKPLSRWSALTGVMSLALIMPIGESSGHPDSKWEPYRLYEYHNESVVLQVHPGDYQFVWEGLGPPDSHAVMQRDGADPHRFELFRAGGIRIEVETAESIAMHLEGRGRAALVSNEFIREDIHEGMLQVQLNPSGRFAFAIDPPPERRDVCVEASVPVVADIYEHGWSHRQVMSDRSGPARCTNVETGFEPVHVFLHSTSDRGGVTLTIGERPTLHYPLVPWLILGTALAIAVAVVAFQMRRRKPERTGPGKAREP